MDFIRAERSITWKVENLPPHNTQRFKTQSYNTVHTSSRVISYAAA